MRVCSKRLNLLKGKSETENGRRTENSKVERKKTNNPPQNITQKTIDSAKPTPQKPEMNFGAPEKSAYPDSRVAPVV